MKPRGHRRRQYDFAGWFAAGEFTLRRFVDYRCSQSSMTQQLRNAAVDLGYELRIVEEPNGLWVTAVPKTKQRTA